MSKPSYPRARRISAVVREVIAEELERLTDPRLSLVTVTGVEVAPDMRRAMVFVSALDLDHLAEALAGLRAAAPRLRSAVGRQVRIKFVPELFFSADKGVVEGERIEALIRQLHAEKGDPDG